MKSYSLALHTSSPEFGLALHRFDGETRSSTWDLGRSLSTHLHVHLADFLAPQTWGDLAFIAVAKGPGSFTGTRMGMVTARTLGEQLNIPVFAISTLAAIAYHRAQMETLPPGAKIAVKMKAVRGKMFVAVYEVGNDRPPVAILDDRVEPEATLPEILAARSRSGDLGESPLSRTIEADGNLGMSVASLLDIANWQWQQGQRPHWSAALPFYGQHPVE